MYTNYLAHYGILGMRWGRKGAMRYKDSKNELRKIRKDIENSETSKKMDSKIEKAYKELNEYAIKNKLDGDDGGGGTVKASRAWNNKLNRIQDLEISKENYINKKVVDSFVSKYGDVAYKRFQSQKDTRRALIGAGIITGILATPFALSAINR